MAFKNKKLSVLSYADDFTLWRYSTDDAVDEVLADGYFDAAHQILHTGDMIFITMHGDGCVHVVELNDKKVKLITVTMFYTLSE